MSIERRLRKAMQPRRSQPDEIKQPTVATRREEWKNVKQK